MTIHILHIGKTGGTAIRAAISTWMDKPQNIYLHDHNKTLKDVPQGEKIIFFLRNPITRFVSGFNSRKRKGQPKYASPWSKEEEIAFSLFDTPLDIIGAASDKNSDLHLEALHGLESIEHVRNRYVDWLISINYVKNRRRDLLLIGFQENLQKDFDKMKVILNIPDYVKLPEDDFDSHRNIESSNIEFNVGETAFLKFWLKQDFEFLELMRNISE